MSRPPAGKDKEWYPDVVYDSSAFLGKPTFTGRYSNIDVSQEFNESKLVQRPTFLRLGVLKNANGSAYIEFGQSKVLVSVSDPREITKPVRKDAQRGKINCTVRYGMFASACEDNVQIKEHYIRSSLKKALEPVVVRQQYANMEFDVKVIVFDEGGCMMSTVINASYAALVDAGVQTFDLLTASTICLYKDKIFVNPDLELEMLASYKLIEEEPKGENGILVVSSFGRDKQLSEVFLKGFMAIETIKRLTGYAITMNQAMRGTLKFQFEKKIKAAINVTETELDEFLQKKRRTLAVPDAQDESLKTVNAEEEVINVPECQE